MSREEVLAAPRTPRTVARSRVVAVLVAIAMVTLAMVGQQVSDVTSEAEIVTAPLDEAVAYNHGEVEVSDVRVATSITQRDDTYTTRGLFVVVHVAVRATGSDEVWVTRSRLLAEGATYDPAFTASESLTADAGFMVERDLVFEVDPARTADLTLELWRSEPVFRYYQRTRTTLGITAGNEADWARAGAGREVDVPRNPTTTALP